MKPFHLFIIGTNLALGLGNAIAAESSGEIRFTGSINGETCYVLHSGSSNSITVEMGSVPANEVGTVASPRFFTGGNQAVANFSVVCASAVGVKMQLAATAGQTTSNGQILVINPGAQQGAGLARNVGIAVYPSTSSTTAYNLTNTVLAERVAATAPGTTTSNDPIAVQFAAAYVRTDGNTAPTAGQADATLPFKIVTP